MYFFFLLIGILVVSVSFEKSKRFGSFILAIVVLSLLLSARKKGIIT